MKIINETELMTNQKASTTILPDLEFKALQTSGGNSLLFSISPTHIFYCTYEVPGDTHGWQRTDLSTPLSKQDFGGQATVKSFDLGQNLVAGTIDLVMVITDSKGKDWLYVSLGNPDANWGGYAPTWQQVKFDDQNNMAFANDPINDVFVARFGSNQFIFADLITNPENQSLSRYAIDPTGQVMYNTNYVNQCWIPSVLSSSLQAGKISSAVGCGYGDESVYGIYSLYTIDGNPQLTYAPLFNTNDVGGAPFPTDFDLKTNITSIDSSHMAMAVSKPSTGSPDTDLFFASEGMLYFCANGDQVNKNNVNPTFKKIYSHDLFQNIQDLYIGNWNDNIVLWGQSIDPTDNTTSRLFIMECVAGQETNPDAWSCPIPLLFNVENSATYIHNIYSLDSAIDAVNGNAYGSCNVLFAEQVITLDDGTKLPTLTQLFQDPVTSAWQARSLLTEPAAENVITEMYETTTYSSHIEIADDNNVATALVPVYAWATSPSNVYITDANNTAAYLTLDPQKPLPLTSDAAGHVTIMQPVDTIGGISYYIAVQDPNSQSSTYKKWYTQVINPLAGTIAKLNTNVPDGTGDHLSGVQVTDELGAKTNLITNSSLKGDQTTTQSGNIYQMCQQNGNVNADGLTSDQVKAGGWPDPATAVAALSAVRIEADAVKHVDIKHRVKKFAKTDRPARHIRFNPATDQVWGCTFGKNAKHYHGIEAVKEMGLFVHADGSLSYSQENEGLGSFLGSIEAKAGHLYKWMKTEAKKLEKMAVTITNGVIDCVLHIAGEAYHFVVKCANDIANAAHTFLNAVETAFKDLVKWLGSIFAWVDILRTHSFFRSLFINYMNYTVKNLGGLQTTIDGLFEQVEKDINTWAGLPTDSYSSQQSNNSGGNGQKHPSSHWANHHIGNNGSNASVAEDVAEAVLDDLKNTVDNEYLTITNAISELQTVFNNAQDMPVADVVKEVVGIMANTVLKSANNLVDSMIEVTEDILDGVGDLITAPLHIPVLSNLYSTFTGGSQLSYLDLACLAAAVPTTVIYKIANGGDAPFPKGDPIADALIAATTMEEIADICYPPAQVSAGVNGGLQYTPNDIKGSAFDKLNFSCNICASFGGIAVSILGFAKTKVSQAPEPPQKVISVLSKLYAACYVPYIAPDIGGVIQYIKTLTPGWYNDLNCFLGLAGFAKTLADLKWSTATKQPEGVSLPTLGIFTLPFGKNVSKGWYEISPLLETVINLVWEVPVVFAYENSKKETNDIISLTANTCFNASGVLTPFVSYTNGTPQLVFAGIGAVLNIGYGVLSAFWALDNYSDA